MDYFEPEATLRFSYTDSEGRMTARLVKVDLVEGEWLHGRDLLKNARRTFRFDRISNCWDEREHKYVRDVLQHLRDIYAQTPAASIDKVFERHYEELKVLFYVARADGRLSAPEVKVITAACKVITRDMRITDEMTRNLLSTDQTPSLQGFKVAVGKIANAGDKSAMRRVAIAARSIIATQKTISPGEQEAMDYIAKRFGDNMPAPPAPRGDEA